MKQFLKQYWYIATLLLLIIGIIFAAKFRTELEDEAVQFSSHIRNGEKFYFHTAWEKFLYGAVIQGTDCSNLKGTNYYTKRMRSGLLGSMGRKDRIFAREIEQIERWKTEKHQPLFQVVCIPYIKDIKPYLATGNGDVDDVVVRLKAGPILALNKVAPWRGNENPHRIPPITSVYACGDNKYQFCADVSYSSKTWRYNVICWKCDKTLRHSAEALKQAVLFQSEDGYVIEGGFMARDKSSFYGDPESVRVAAEAADERLAFILSFIEPQIKAAE